MGVGEVTDTNPINWYVRIQFDELLNTKVEDLEPILDNGQPSGLFSGTLKNTQPVTITCGGVDVPYGDGSYYDPSGNNVTWPLGPSLFVTPLDTSVIATGTECTAALKPDGVENKVGGKVATANNGLGPWTFKIAPLALLGVTPAFPDDPTKPPTQSAMAPALVTLNAAVSTASLAVTDVQIVEATDCMGTGADLPTAHPATITVDEDGQSLDIADSTAPTGDAFTPGKTYIITFTANAPIKDKAGGPGVLVDSDNNSPKLCFTTST